MMAVAKTDKTRKYLAIKKFNEELWDSRPDRAESAAIDAIRTGGFGCDCLDRRVGNYEGQIMAIERGWVDEEKYGYIVNQDGLDALRRHGIIVRFLPGKDTWHGRDFEYCVYELENNGKPALKLFSESIPKGGDLGMKPTLDVNDIVALRDYLNDWITRKTGDNK